MNDKINKLKKIIKYRLSYSGMKETDIIYKRLILDKLDNLSKKELETLSILFNEVADIEIFNFLTKKSEVPLKYKYLIKKIINE